MTSSTSFRSYPSFPEDVPTAPLSKISLTKLYANDEAEHRKLFDTYRQIGFFLLDLAVLETGQALIFDINATLELTEEIMAMPEE